jgi:hypothetical protein
LNCIGEEDGLDMEGGRGAFDIGMDWFKSWIYAAFPRKETLTVAGGRLGMGTKKRPVAIRESRPGAFGLR